MSYSTLKMLRTALAPGDFDATVSERSNTAADLSDEQLLDAIAEADSMIDAAIGGRYVTPAALQNGVGPGPLSFWSRNIAGYLATCTFRRSQDFGDTDPVYRRYAVTMQFLTAVAKGEYPLALPVNDNTSTSSAGAGAALNPNGGRLFDGSDLDLGPGWGVGWPFDGGSRTLNPLLNPLEGSVESFEALARGYGALPDTGGVVE